MALPSDDPQPAPLTAHKPTPTPKAKRKSRAKPGAKMGRPAFSDVFPAAAAAAVAIALEKGSLSAASRATGMGRDALSKLMKRQQPDLLAAKKALASAHAHNSALANELTTEALEARDAKGAGSYSVCAGIHSDKLHALTSQPAPLVQIDMGQLARSVEALRVVEDALASVTPAP